MKVVDISTLDDAGRVALACELATNFSGSLPTELLAAAFSLKSKLPFKATSLREVLFHRVTELARVAVELFEAKRLVPAFVITRAVVETVAVLFWLHEKTEEFLKNQDIEAYDDFLMRALVGSRDGTTRHESYNVLTAVDRLDKRFSGLRSAYDTLCEFTHPNWAGAMGSFSKIDHEQHRLVLGVKPSGPPVSFGLDPLIISLVVTQDYYNDLARVLGELNAYFERQQ